MLLCAEQARRYFIKTANQLSLLEKENRTPLYDAITTISDVDGLRTARASQMEVPLCAQLQDSIRAAVSPSFFLWSLRVSKVLLRSSVIAD